MSKSLYLVVTPFFPSPINWRGPFVLDQVKAIQRNSEYEVVVFVGGNDNSDYEIDGTTVHRYKTRELPSNILNGFFNGYNSRSFVKRVLEVGIDPKDVAFVHCHVSMRAACGIALKKLNPNIKVLLQHHDPDPFNLRSGVIGRYNRVNIWYKVRKALKLYNKVDLHVCISQMCKDSLLSFPEPRTNEVYEDYLRVLGKAKGLPHVEPKATYLLYNGVDTSLFNENENISENPHKPSTLNHQPLFRIGSIGNMIDWKSQIDIAKALHVLVCKGYKDVRLSMIGTGETRASIEEYIEKNNLIDYVEWPKEVTHDKLPDYYRSLDLFVLPSYFEGFGCVFTEAAACGVPYMGCVNQGYSEYVADKEKWLVQPHDYEQLAKLIEEYYLSSNGSCAPVGAQTSKLGASRSREQVLCHPYDINILIKDFLKYIETL